MSLRIEKLKLKQKDFYRYCSQCLLRKKLNRMDIIFGIVLNLDHLGQIPGKLESD